MADVTLLTTIGAGLGDGIFNPCALAVLTFLLTITLELSNKRKVMLRTGIIYVLAVYITYFFAGLGILKFMGTLGPNPGLIIYNLGIAVAIIFGLVNLKDFLNKKGEFLLKIPKRAGPIIEKYAHKATHPLGAMILGVLVSIFELPCSGEVYISILALLDRTTAGWQAMGYLGLYNFMFVLPLILIIVGVYLGMKAEHIENWRKTERKWMKLLMALLLFGIAAFMLFAR